MIKTNKSLLVLGFALAASLPAATLDIISVAGANQAAVQGTVDAFRAQLGAINANVAGSFGSGRREINWDGVGAAFRDNLPANFFNANSPRGVVMETPGTGFAVSGDSPVEFGNLNATYPGEFQTFSATRLFTALGSTVLDVLFFVPGSNTPATVSGLGAIFTDVDLADITRMQTFDSLGNMTSDTAALTQNGGLSFIGVRMDSPDDAAIARVRFLLGNLNVGGTENPGAVEFASDVVVLDDFIYGEPTAASAVPEPSSIVLLSSAVALLAAGLRKRNRRLAAR